MSATPVINNLLEGKRLIELLTGVKHDDLQTASTVENCITLYQKFVAHGVRYIPCYSQKYNEIKVPVDVSYLVSDIRKAKTYVALEGILAKAKLPCILDQLRLRTIVYTHYRDGIEIFLQDAIVNDGWRVGFFNGDDKAGLKDFLEGRIDILIATGCIGTGVDGLQFVCNRLVIVCLPWTHAEYKQLVGRIYRQGQISDQVDIIIPLTYSEINDVRWSWCEARLMRIEFKKTIADAAVDGVIPERHLPSPEQAYKGAMALLERLASGDIREIKRTPIAVEFSNDDINSNRVLRNISDFVCINQRINAATSEENHCHFLHNPHEWHNYHSVYRNARNSWEVIPYEEAIVYLKQRPSSWIIGDFGCGEAFLAKELSGIVYSFDHVAINERVISCDMKKVPLLDGTLDAAVFSLSLMGTNWIDYIGEAHRCLKLDGQLWIAEPVSRFKDLNLFRELIYKLGFDVISLEKKWKFFFLRAIKSERSVNKYGTEELLQQLGKGQD